MTATRAPIPLTVVMPVYNEEEAIVAAVEEVQRHVLDLVPGRRSPPATKRYSVDDAKMPLEAHACVASLGQESPGMDRFSHTCWP